MSTEENIDYVKNQKLLKYLASYLFLVYYILLWIAIAILIITIFHRTEMSYKSTFLISTYSVIFLVLIQIVTGGLYRCPKCNERIFAYRGDRFGAFKFAGLPYQILFKKRFTCPYCHQKFTLIKSEAMPPVED